MLKRCIVKIVRGNSEIRGNMITDHFEPAALLGDELVPRGSCWATQDLKVCVNSLGERDEFVVLMDGEADEGYEVRQDAFAVVPLTFDLSRAA